MNEIVDQAMFAFLDGLFLNLADIMGVFLADAQAIAAICMLLYFGMEAFKMISGDEELRVMPLLRPFALTFVIIFWGGFIDALNVPLKVVDNTAMKLYKSQDAEVQALFVERKRLIYRLAQRISESTADIEAVAAEKEDKTLTEKLGISLDPLMAKMTSYWLMVKSKIEFMFMQFFEAVVLIIFQVCIYLIYFLKIIFAGILVVLGPFSFAISILPGFRDSYITWIGRYISISLYSTIGYVIMSMSFLMLKYGLDLEIKAMKTAMGSEATFIAYVSMSSGNLSFFLVTLLLAAVVMLTIPIISTWIVNTSGIGQATSTMARGAGSIAGKMFK